MPQKCGFPTPELTENASCAPPVPGTARGGKQNEFAVPFTRHHLQYWDEEHFLLLMSKSRIAILAIIVAFSVVTFLQLQTAAQLRRNLAAAGEENARLHQNLTAQDQVSSSSSLRVGSSADEKPAEPQQKRLRGAAGRAARAEAEVAQLKSALESHQVSTAVPVPDANSNSNLILAYVGEAVPPPANINPAYTKHGLINAIQQAAQLAGVSLKKVEIDTSEFPFLVGAVCDSDADFEKVKAQFKNMPDYEYGGATSSHGTYAFNITPYRGYPPEAGERIARRMPLRMQMFFNQLNTR